MSAAIKEFLRPRIMAPGDATALQMVEILYAAWDELHRESSAVRLVCSWCGDDFEPGDWSSTDCCSCDPVPASALPAILKAARRENEETMREWEAETAR